MGSQATPITNITLYATLSCPWAQRARIAIRETGVAYHEHYIDLKNKPEWYLKDVNPAGLVPAITFGGPDVPPDQPSPASTKLRESGPIIEWIADSFPKAGLLPEDPLLRYRVRIFTYVIGNKFLPAFNSFVYSDGTAENVIKGLEALQAELVPGVKYAVSDSFTIADAAVAPFLGRLDLLLSNDVGVYEEGAGKKVHEVLSTDKRFERLWNYTQALKERPSIKSTFPAEDILAHGKTRTAAAKAAKK
ncbi:hypothetical protein M422DRAFT_27900 [Sphaerobolus stellatus SS14]|nr:hypothetical protein M422DRAFT_27900 [Sphaerobolus stellatus SS14]